METSPVALVTGCSTGIGRALAEELAQRGHRVYASARNPASLSSLASERFRPLALDVTSAASIAEAVARVMAESGRIDVLVNNAGVNAFGPIVELPLDDVRRLFDTNVMGLMAVTQAVFPHMARARRGTVVNIGSVVGLLPTPFAGPYCASKAAVHALSEVLRMEMRPFGIDVVVVQPGGVRSAIAENGSRGIERYAREGSHYAFAAPQIRARASASQDRPMEAEDFAREVVDALSAPSPRAVVRKGRGARLYPALSILPRRLRDAILTRRFGLGTR